MLQLPFLSLGLTKTKHFSFIQFLCYVYLTKYEKQFTTPCLLKRARKMS
jgi:hypothetical protein